MTTKLAKIFFVLLTALSLATGGVFLFPPKSVQADFYPDSDVPQILPRSTWENTPELKSLMTWLPQPATGSDPSDWQPIERIVLHDTGCDPNTNPTCNNNTDPIPSIQAMYRYHAVTRGWGDIGYSYIIDQQGRIYEGRYGGNGSRAAHLYVDRTKDNFNFGSIGISVLGNYAQAYPSEAVYQSMIRLVAWLAASNGLDPAGQKSSTIWNLLKSGFNSFYTGPIVVGHKDIEAGNPDPKNFDFERIRREASALALKYQNYLYQAEGSPKIYKISNGTRKTYANIQEYTAQGGTYDKIISLPQSQLDIFSETRFLKYPDGSLLQAQGNPSVYLIENGAKRSLSVDAKQFVKLGFDFARVKTVTADDLSGYPDGLPVKYGKDGQLLSDGARVFWTEGGKKRWVPTGTLFAALGYKWNKVKTSADELASMMEGDLMSYPNGTLVRPASSQSVYLFDSGKLRQILSAEIFKNLKYSWAKVKVMPDADLVIYPLGEPVKYKEGQLLRPKSSSNVYIVSGGKAVAVDAATFKKKKYKWANVLVIADADFNALYGKTPTAPTPIPATPSPTPCPTPIPTQTPIYTPVPSPTPTPQPVSSSPKMRVAVQEITTPTVTLSATTAYNVLDRSGQIIATKNANENYVYTVPSSGAFVKIAPQTADGIVQIISLEDRPSWKPTLNYNQFRGTVEIIYSAKSAKTWAVNELDLEDYLKGIAEINNTDPAGHQKTMITAARTYAYHYILKGGKRGTDEVYILNNTSNDQLYKGYTRESVAPAVVEAVNATRGEMAYFNNQPIVTAYSSGAAELYSGSGTKSACSLWGGAFCGADYAYLSGGVKDPASAPYTQTACGGGNHCVGLSAAGSRAFAVSGEKNYQEVLKYYYPGIEIRKVY